MQAKMKRLIEYQTPGQEGDGLVESGRTLLPFPLCTAENSGTGADRVFSL